MRSRATPLAGLLGGLLSSTNVTFTFARLSRREPVLARPLAIGTVAACTLFPRVMVAAFVLNFGVARLLLPYLLTPFIIGVASLAVWWRSRAEAVPESEGPGNPLQIIPALQMAVIFQIVLFAVAIVGRTFGAGGIRVAGAVLGLTDVDALTVSMTTTPLSSSAPAAAAAAIAIGVLTNCMMKTVLAAVLGTPDFRRLSGSVLAAMATAVAVAIGVLR